jgi:CPA2 family monovalent cation:H+ antiporter-2
MEAVDLAGFKELLIVLGAAGVVIPLFHRLRISPVLGYMLIGIAVGPFGFGRLAALLPAVAAVTIADPEAIAPIARLGIVLLMFMIGLELSFERLWLMRRLVFGLGALQVVISVALIAAAARALGADPRVAVVLGLAGAMSSTAVVLQVLGAGKRLGTPTGRASFAILLFQDLAVVPILLVLGLLTRGGGGHADLDSENIGRVAMAVGQALLAVSLIVVFGRLALRPLFRSVARTRSPELFMAACLLVVLGAALASASAGLSMALGALLGGLLLAGTEYRRQVELTIAPFKGLFVGVFLISIGLGLDPLRIAAAPLTILGGSALLIALKLAVIAALARLFGLAWASGLQSGLLLAAGSEFSFVIVAAAADEGLLPRAASDPILAIAALTMALIPLLGWVGTRLAPRLTPARRDPALAEPVPRDGHARVVIAGFGRVGQTVAALLEAHRVDYVALDRDADRVTRQRRAGKPVFYGDILQTALLRQLDLAAARALVVTLDDAADTEDVVAAARAERPDLVIVARARDAAHAAALYRAGATDAVPETIEASLQLSEAVLVDVGIAMGPVIASIHEKRDEIRAGIKAMAPQAQVRRLGHRRLRDTAPQPAKAQEAKSASRPHPGAADAASSD